MCEMHEVHVKLFNVGMNVVLNSFGNGDGNYFTLLEDMVDKKNTIFQNVKRMD